MSFHYKLECVPDRKINANTNDWHNDKFLVEAKAKRAKCIRNRN